MSAKRYTVWIPRMGDVGPGAEIWSGVPWVIEAETAGKARYLAWLTVSDPCPSVRLIDIRVRRAA